MSVPSGGWQSDSGLLDIVDDATHYNEPSSLTVIAVSIAVLIVVFTFLYLSTKDKE
ncbi:hypothetical protein [Pueribacillus sp. YX66]|uniref:hypothetical protein n=1 Tax=Pueribacillus sp. YX66 TaxID=3229242 RepID=UPI00358D0EE9